MIFISTLPVGKTNQLTIAIFAIGLDAAPVYAKVHMSTASAFSIVACVGVKNMDSSRVPRIQLHLVGDQWPGWVQGHDPVHSEKHVLGNQAAYVSPWNIAIHLLDFQKVQVCGTLNSNVFVLICKYFRTWSFVHKTSGYFGKYEHIQLLRSAEKGHFCCCFLFFRLFISSR